MISFFKYLCAFIYDGFIICSLFFLITLLIVLRHRGAAVQPMTLWHQGVLIGVLYFYYAISNSWGGQTIGMKAWKLKLISTHGKLSHPQLLKRFILYIPAAIISFICLKNPGVLLTRWTQTQIINV